jgi:3-oxoacyl-[acyl-carrier-protein] synthase-3
MAKIIGLGEWFPSTVRTNDAWSPELVEKFQSHLQRELVDVMGKKVDDMDSFSLAGFQSEANDPFVGTVQRYVADDSTASYEAEVFAANVAIKNSGIDPAKINAVYSWAVTPDIVNLTMATRIGKNVGAKEFFGFGIEGACTSFVAQLTIAKALVDTGEIEYALLTQSHLMTRTFPLSHPASPNLGDGATAILVGPDSHVGHSILTTHSRSDGDYADAVAWKRKEDNQAWYCGGGDYILGTFDRDRARELVLSTVKLGALTTTEALAKVNLTPNDLDFFVSMNPRKWIPSAIAQTMGLPETKTLNTFERYAHLGGCGTLANLMEAERLGYLKAGSLVGLYAQGSGFTRSSVILKWMV